MDRQQFKEMAKIALVCGLLMGVVPWLFRLWFAYLTLVFPVK